MIRVYVACTSYRIKGEYSLLPCKNILRRKAVNNPEIILQSNRINSTTHPTFLSQPQIQPMGQIARCYISPIEPGHPDTCHIRDFSGSLRLPASLTNIHGESCGGPSLAPSDVSKYFPCESQWQLFLYPDLLEHDHAECFQTRRRKP